MALRFLRCKIRLDPMSSFPCISTQTCMAELLRVSHLAYYSNTLLLSQQMSWRRQSYLDVLRKNLTPTATHILRIRQLCGAMISAWVHRAST